MELFYERYMNDLKHKPEASEIITCSWIEADICLERLANLKEKLQEKKHNFLNEMNRILDEKIDHILESFNSVSDKIDITASNFEASLESFFDGKQLYDFHDLENIILKCQATQDYSELDQFVNEGHVDFDTLKRKDDIKLKSHLMFEYANRAYEEILTALNTSQSDLESSLNKFMASSTYAKIDYTKANEDESDDINGNVQSQESRESSDHF